MACGARPVRSLRLACIGCSGVSCHRPSRHFVAMRHSSESVAKVNLRGTSSSTRSRRPSRRFSPPRCQVAPQDSSTSHESARTRRGRALQSTAHPLNRFLHLLESISVAIAPFRLDRLPTSCTLPAQRGPSSYECSQLRESSPERSTRDDLGRNWRQFAARR